MYVGVVALFRLHNHVNVNNIMYGCMYFLFAHAAYITLNITYICTPSSELIIRHVIAYIFILVHVFCASYVSN